MLTAGEVLGRATQMRKERRGDMYREDYPERDDRYWLRAIVVRGCGEQMSLQTAVLDPRWSDRAGDMAGIRWG